MYRLLPMLCTVASLLLPTSLRAQKVRTDYDHAANFEKYKTYKWVTVNNTEQVNQLVDQRIRSAIDAQLAKEGFTKSEDNPDLLVDYQASITKQTQLTTINNGGGGPGWGMGPRWGYGWGNSGISTTTSSSIPIGTLAIDLMDPQQKQLVFRGVATDTLSDKPEKNTGKIDKAVTKIFAKYPPKG